jgi:diguanylate cyclase (GGDEF)-like protein
MDTEDRETEIRVRFWDRVPVRLGAGVVLIASGALALALSIVTTQEERQFAELHVTEANKIAAVIAGDLAKRMLSGGGASVWSTVSAEAVQHVETTGTSRILVLNRDGLVKAASETAAQGTRIEPGGNPGCPKCDSARPEDFPAAGKFSTPEGVRILRIINRIPTSPACGNCHETSGTWRGLVSVDFDLTALERGEAEQRRSVLAIGLAASIVLTGLIWLLFRKLVMRSITSITRTAQHLADGDLTARTEVHGRNELSLLARQFNRMAGRIGDQVNRIKAAQLESALLYALVVESAKSLETTDMAAGVFRVILEKLHPEHVAFFLETTDGRWICATGAEQPAGNLTAGEGELEAALTSNTAPIGNLLGDLPPKLISDACRTRTLQFVRNGHTLSFALPLVSDAKLIGMLACIADSSKVRVQKELLNHLGANLALAAANSRNYSGAITDSLTRLRNKGYGLVRLEEAIYTAKRYRTGLALAMCDIDFFKRVNDVHGHPAGDAVLKEVSRRVAESLRKSDIAVRYGGEEFMVIIPQATAEATAVIGEKIRQAIAAAPVEMGVGQDPIAVTLSVGVAAFHAETDTAESLIARADAALYSAKRGGRNRVEVDA